MYPYVEALLSFNNSNHLYMYVGTLYNVFVLKITMSLRFPFYQISRILVKPLI